jgi:hypothetical protein
MLSLFQRPFKDLSNTFHSWVAIDLTAATSEVVSRALLAFNRISIRCSYRVFWLGAKLESFTKHEANPYLAVIHGLPANRDFLCLSNTVFSNRLQQPTSQE